MAPEHWPFEEFCGWLTTRATALGAEAFAVDLQRTSEPRYSVIRLRAERGTRVGELLVWGNGMAEETVLDLESGDFVYERDGLQLGEDWADQLHGFFEHIGFH